jgi:hypothetical protein
LPRWIQTTKRSSHLQPGSHDGRSTARDLLEKTSQPISEASVEGILFAAEEIENIPQARHLENFWFSQGPIFTVFAKMDTDYQEVQSSAARIARWPLYGERFTWIENIPQARHLENFWFSQVNLSP